MSGTGRPLRFMVLVLGAWIGLRVWQLWPEPPTQRALRKTVRRVAGMDEPRGVKSLSTSWASVVAPPRPLTRRQVSASRPGPVETVSTGGVFPTSPATRSTSQPEQPPAILEKPFLTIPPASASSPRRWSVSGWAIVRGAGAGGALATPQLGGSQAGVRIVRALDRRGRVAIVTRVAAALDVRQQEAALGIEWRPTSAPVRVVAERRFGLANQRGGPALGLVSGVSDVRLPADFRLDAYAQAGAVLRREVDAYADGEVRIMRPVAAVAGRTRLSLGVGVWGGAQREAQRLDVGPAAMIELPLGRALRLRVALEWRQRIVGNARPGSGPALSIGTDY